MQSEGREGVLAERFGREGRKRDGSLVNRETETRSGFLLQE